VSKVAVKGRLLVEQWVAMMEIQLVGKMGSRLGDLKVVNLGGQTVVMWGCQLVVGMVERKAEWLDASSVDGLESWLVLKMDLKLVVQ
jgi:hypothetical protein